MFHPQNESQQNSCCSLPHPPPPPRSRPPCWRTRASLSLGPRRFTGAKQGSFHGGARGRTLICFTWCDFWPSVFVVFLERGWDLYVFMCDVFLFFSFVFVKEVKRRWCSVCWKNAWDACLMAWERKHTESVPSILRHVCVCVCVCVCICACVYTNPRVYLYTHVSHRASSLCRAAFPFHPVLFASQSQSAGPRFPFLKRVALTLNKYSLIRCPACKSACVCVCVCVCVCCKLYYCTFSSQAMPNHMDGRKQAECSRLPKSPEQHHLTP